MRSYTIIFHADAETEYREPFIWYEQKSDGLGFRFRNVVNDKIEELKLNPEMYAQKKRGFREAPVP